MKNLLQMQISFQRLKFSSKGLSTVVNESRPRKILWSIPSSDYFPCALSSPWCQPVDLRSRAQNLRSTWAKGSVYSKQHLRFTKCKLGSFFFLTEYFPKGEKNQQRCACVQSGKLNSWQKLILHSTVNECDEIKIDSEPNLWKTELASGSYIWKNIFRIPRLCFFVRLLHNCLQ